MSKYHDILPDRAGNMRGQRQADLLDQPFEEQEGHAAVENALVSVFKSVTSFDISRSSWRIGCGARLIPIYHTARTDLPQAIIAIALESATFGKRVVKSS